MKKKPGRKNTYEGMEDLDWQNIAETRDFCPKCREAGKKLIYDNARLENDLLVYEYEVNRIIKAAQFQRSDDLLCGNNIKDIELPEYLEDDEEEIIKNEL